MISALVNYLKPCGRPTEREEIILRGAHLSRGRNGSYNFAVNFWAARNDRLAGDSAIHAGSIVSPVLRNKDAIVCRVGLRAVRWRLAEMWLKACAARLGGPVRERPARYGLWWLTLWPLAGYWISSLSPHWIV
jgi:hypothetical protein